ncbi:hypothetical protein HK097_002949 [Rhizophlyctis rosea]|uniref:Glutamine synthetase n=1 Tax=Rhizophlyctis rosea TaxID=64517 RepID=A0AAD5S4S9_9FUNG|nr:hypothetical protein HK097_002949 [Rhizophlyctis rosea]
MPLHRLLNEIAALPAIDAHCHPLLSNVDESRVPFLSIVSEAEGDALKYTTDTLVFKRAIREISKCLNTEPSIKAIVEARESITPPLYLKGILEETKIHSLLVDDGLIIPGVSTIPHTEVPSTHPSKRIFRLEMYAESAFKESLETPILLNNSKNFDLKSNRTAVEQSVHKRWQNQFTHKIQSAECVAFKSIAAYRYGLQDLHVADEGRELEKEIAEAIDRFKPDNEYVAGRASEFRLEGPAFVRQVVQLGLDVAEERGLPVQFHVGIGDRDLDLAKANPLLLRPLFEKWRKVKFVLLHVYPFAREAAYLASVYENVYVDFGLADLVLSADGENASIPLIIPVAALNLNARLGQTTTIRELLHLAPTSKIQFSTDAHFHPEGILLGSKWGRKALAEVLNESVEAGELDFDEAVDVARDILFGNANRIYGLGWAVEEKGREENFIEQPRDVGETTDTFVKNGVKAVRVTWVDISNLTRTKLIPATHFASIASTGISVVSAVMGFPMTHDVVAIPTKTINVTTDAKLVPDLSTLKQLPYHPNHAVVLGTFRDGSGRESGGCARVSSHEVECTLRGLFVDRFDKPNANQSTLHRLLSHLQKTYNLTLQAGFELEFTLLTTSGDPVDSTNYAEWGALSPKVAAVLDEIVEYLEAQGIEVELFHPESAGGQFEVVLRYGRARWMGDAVVLARQNKEAPLRGLKDNVEYKAMDGTANPYLALAALLAAGLHGLESKLELPPPVNVDPSTLPESERPDRLPTKFMNALVNFERDEELRKRLGEEIVDCFVAVKGTEAELHSNMRFEDARDAVMSKF